MKTLHAKRPRGIQQHSRSQRIRPHKNLRIRNAAVDVRLRRKVDDASKRSRSNKPNTNALSAMSPCTKLYRGFCAASQTFSRLPA